MLACSDARSLASRTCTGKCRHSRPCQSEVQGPLLRLRESWQQVCATAGEPEVPGRCRRQQADHERSLPPERRSACISARDRFLHSETENLNATRCERLWGGAGGGQPSISLETTEIWDPHLDTFMAGGRPAPPLPSRGPSGADWRCWWHTSWSFSLTRCRGDQRMSMQEPAVTLAPHHLHLA